MRRASHPDIEIALEIVIERTCRAGAAQHREGKASHLPQRQGPAFGRGHARKDHALNPINTDFDLHSMGVDGQTKPQITQRDSLDDIIRAGTGKVENYTLTGTPAPDEQPKEAQ